MFEIASSTRFSASGCEMPVFAATTTTAAWWGSKAGGKHREEGIAWSGFG
jgi:hypothetical protein